MKLPFRNQEDKQRSDGTRGRWVASYALLVVPLVFLLIFYLYPLVGIARASLLGLDRLDLAPLMARLISPGILRVIGFTFSQALLSTVL
ncbi:MAG: hypothetical protein U9R05_07575, partial [Chloroflexota bacterium]|nr:hypothetical protein [Chloroflexota bacterium]